MRRTPRLALVLTLFALVGAACGGDDGSEETKGSSDGAGVELTEDEQAYADVFAEDFADEDDGFGVSADDADCMAAAVMGELGTDPFEDADVQAEDLSGDDTPGQLLGEGAVSMEQAEAIYAGWTDCVDLDAVFADSFRKEYEGDAATAECFRSGLEEDDLMQAYVVASFTSGDELDPSEPPLKSIVALVATCTANGEDGSGGALVDSIASSLAASGSLTDEQASCLAQSIVDQIGADELLEGAADGDLKNASPELQSAVVQAVVAAAESCGVPLSDLGGG